ncbi:MAG TPA: S8 family peptidase [Terriglobia bacterium]|nr:S8 family peptidase [Terriglobia bacterium]
MIRKLALIGLFIFSASAFGKNAKIARDLDTTPGKKVDVIVTYNHAVTTSQHQKVFSRGGTLRTELKSVKGGAYTISSDALEDLASDPEVAHISPDRKLKGMLDLTAAAVNASAAWTAGWYGAGIGVAVIDSGVANEDDLNNNNVTLAPPNSHLPPGSGNSVVYAQSFVAEDTNDHYGHGTHVAGIIAASGKDSICAPCTRTLRGMAPEASIINLKALNQNGAGTDSSVIAAIEQAIALKSKYNIRVINLSLGRPVFESYTQDPLCQAVEAAWKAGIVVVVAAGNDGRDNSQGTEGYGTITAPGNDPYVITVGAMKTEGTPTRTDDLIASYSSKGPTMIDHVVKPDIVAPGNQVVSLLASGGATLPKTYSQTLIPTAYYSVGPANSGKYFVLSGTSMATPVVSGAVADMLQAQPSLTPDQVKARLMKTAYKIFPSSSTTTDPTTGAVYVDQYDVLTVGAGYLDIQAALADTTVATGTALSPTASVDPTTGDVYLVADPSSVWDTRSVWGTQSVWGVRSVWGNSAFVSGSNALWGSQAVWGTRSVWGNRSVWGTTSVWGTSATDATEATSVIVNGEP